jgi:hypothetical protein
MHLVLKVWSPIEVGSFVAPPRLCKQDAQDTQDAPMSDTFGLLQQTPSRARPRAPPSVCYLFSCVSYFCLSLSLVSHRRCNVSELSEVLRAHVVPMVGRCLRHHVSFPRLFRAKCPDRKALALLGLGRVGSSVDRGTSPRAARWKRAQGYQFADCGGLPCGSRHLSSACKRQAPTTHHPTLSTQSSELSAQAVQSGSLLGSYSAPTRRRLSPPHFIGCCQCHSVLNGG